MQFVTLSCISADHYWNYYVLQALHLLDQSRSRLLTFDSELIYSKLLEDSPIRIRLDELIPYSEPTPIKLADLVNTPYDLPDGGTDCYDCEVNR